MFKCMSLRLHGCCEEREGWICKSVDHTSLVTVVTPTDCPKSIRNHCEIKYIGGVSLCYHFAVLAFSLGIMAFVIGLSQGLFSFFS